MPLIGMAGSSVMMLPMMPAMKVAIDNGFEAFELFGEFPQCVCSEISSEQRKEGRALVAESGIALAVHAPFNSLNIAAFNAGVRKESISQAIDAINLCADLGGSAVVVHGGRYILPDHAKQRTPQAFEAQMQLNIETLRELAGHAAERDVTLCLENIGFEDGDMDCAIDDLLTIREKADAENLYLCLDIGHARLCGHLDKAIEKMGPYIRHIHLTDNFGENDDHLVIGEGNFDYTPYLDFFQGFEYIITLEVIKVGTDPDYAIRSKKNIEDIFTSG